MKEGSKDLATYLIEENGTFPNNPVLPLLIAGQVFDKSSVTAERFEHLFTSNSWPAAWRNGLYSVHHYHSTAHEALGIYSGWVVACFGGPGGTIVRAEAGDVIIIPAGVSHCNNEQSPDFRVVGAYPVNQQWDMKYGKVGERPIVDQAIYDVPRPVADPVFGSDGGLKAIWK